MATHSAKNTSRSSVRKKPQLHLPKSVKARSAILVVLLALIAGITFAVVGGGTAKVTLPPVPTNNCPLTDLPASGGVPNRPAIAIKIGNEPGAPRPQSGLNEADVVFDTPAEGFIMRYVAVFQCQSASAIGPIRSVRWVDQRLASELGHPILAFAGGIDPDVNAVEAQSDLTAANLLEGAEAAGHRTTDREAPDNLYTSTSAIYALFPKLKGKPKPIFSYSTAVPSGGTKVRAFRLDFSAGTDVLWEWNKKMNTWIHTYARNFDHDAITGDPVTATNIAVVSVNYTFGPYLESPGGSGDFESQTVGSGPGYVLRNGTAFKVTWSRSDTSSPMIFKDSSGKIVNMAPGRTWVELDPDTTFKNSSDTSLLLAVPKKH